MTLGAEAVAAVTFFAWGWVEGTALWAANLIGPRWLDCVLTVATLVLGAVGFALIALILTGGAVMAFGIAASAGGCIVALRVLFGLGGTQKLARKKVGIKSEKTS